jgi:hypothetical protein
MIFQYNLFLKTKTKMQKPLLKSLIISTLTLISVYSATAQDAVTYLNSITKPQDEISKDYMSYVSAVSHGKSARKVEKRRIALLESALNARRNAALMPAFQGDKVLKDALTNYVTIVYNVLNEDYGKIVNLEDIAEQSYDNMEAYFMAQELAGQKQDAAFKKFKEAYEGFAKKNSINLIQQENELSMKLKQADAVNSYYHKLYLMFFKPYKQEYYLMDAVNRKDVSGIEQNKNTLVKFAKENLSKLDTMKAFQGDRSLVNSCKDLMRFYIDESSKMQVYTDFQLKSENFDKMSKAFNAKPARQRTQADVDAYNKGVNDINALSTQYNKTNQELNNNRGAYINKWNDTVNRFLDAFTPKYR